jgi:hypothetical protein
MKIGSGIVIGKDDAAGASAVRKPPEDRRLETETLTLLTPASSDSSDLTCVLHAHLCRECQRNWGFVGTGDIQSIVGLYPGSMCILRCWGDVVGTTPQLHLTP